MKQDQQTAHPMLTWDEVQIQYRDEWVAFTEWEEDEHGDVIKGHVAYHHASRKVFYEHLKTNMRPRVRKIASRYTGNIKGPFFLGLCHD
ncbi:MAG: hypothetical protein HYV02_06090 [Deltaproteobacteria bacterium]|nr:hypothetical protein [Deltaproteobacteria bacterium]